MAIDVNKPSSSSSPTKLTSAIPPPPCRDHQHNKNQTIPTITTQDQAFDFLSYFGFAEDPFAPIDSSGYTVLESDASDREQDDFNWITLEEQMYEEQCNAYSDNKDDYGESLEIPDGMFAFDDKFTVTAMITTEDEEAYTSMPTMIKEEPIPTTIDPPADTIRIDDDTPTTTIDTNKNMKKKKETKATLKTPIDADVVLSNKKK